MHFCIQKARMRKISRWLGTRCSRRSVRKRKSSASCVVSHGACEESEERCGSLHFYTNFQCLWPLPGPHTPSATEYFNGSDSLSKLVTAATFLLNFLKRSLKVLCRQRVLVFNSRWKTEMWMEGISESSATFLVTFIEYVVGIRARTPIFKSEAAQPYLLS